MGYVEAEGDLLGMRFSAIGHGCNISGSMSGGIARTVQLRYPEMHTAYVDRCARGEFALGDLLVWDTGDIVFYNLATQVASGREARLSAVCDTVRAALADAESRWIDRLGIPRLGTGLGGLEWRDVRRALQEISGASPVELVVVCLPPRKIALALAG